MLVVWSGDLCEVELIVTVLIDSYTVGSTAVVENTSSSLETTPVCVVLELKLEVEIIPMSDVGRNTVVDRSRRSMTVETSPEAEELVVLEGMGPVSALNITDSSICVWVEDTPPVDDVITLIGSTVCGEKMD